MTRGTYSLHSERPDTVDPVACDSRSAQGSQARVASWHPVTLLVR